MMRAANLRPALAHLLNYHLLTPGAAQANFTRMGSQCHSTSNDCQIAGCRLLQAEERVLRR